MCVVGKDDMEGMMGRYDGGEGNNEGGGRGGKEGEVN